MKAKDPIVWQLAQKISSGALVLPDAHNAARHMGDFATKTDRTADILAIAYPRTTEDVVGILKFCNEHAISVQPQGGMTGLAGGGVPSEQCVIVSMERMRTIREVDVAAATMTVEAGAVLEAIQRAADAADLFFPLDLGARGSCQIGGNVSTNAGGNRVLRFGMARDLVLGVEAVLADGSVIDALRKVTKNNAGYDLRQLFIGAEGTLGIVTAVVLRLFPKPKSICTGLCAVANYDAVLELLKEVRAGFGSQLTSFEVMWPSFYQLATEGLGHNSPLCHSAGAYVLVETMGLEPDMDLKRYESVMGNLLERGVIDDSIIAQSMRESLELWKIRDSPSEWQRTPHWPHLSFDVSAPTGEIGALVKDIDIAITTQWPDRSLVHFGHVADGNLHVSISTSGSSIPESAIEDAVYAVAARRRGSISAEHGIGSLKRRFLRCTRSPEEIQLMRTIKQALDPNGILNPGKIL